MIPQLEQMIKQKISSHLADKVDMAAETDRFSDLVALAMRALVQGVAGDRLDAAFRALSASNWATAAEVEEESAYCRQMHVELSDAVPRIRDALSPTYFNNFCMKCAAEILQRHVFSFKFSRN